MGCSPGSQENPLNQLGLWSALSRNNTWVPRDGSGLLGLDGVLYWLGGWNPLVWAAPSTVNHVWKSTDGGRTWSQISNAPWEVRHSAGWLVGDGRIWVVGGDANTGHYQYDVWSAVPDGSGDLTWTLVTANAAPLSQGRVLHQTFWFDDKIWIVGGQTINEIAPSTKPGSPYYSDVWSSPDGVTWTLISDSNSWSPNVSVIGSVVKDDKIWLVGGGAYDTQGNPRVYKNSVWSSEDGVTWVDVPQTAPFTPRQYNSICILRDHFVIVGGTNGSDMNDCWVSKDGSNWRQVATPWPARHATSAVVYDDELIMLGGPLTDTTVWKMK